MKIGRRDGDGPDLRLNTPPGGADGGRARALSGKTQPLAGGWLGATTRGERVRLGAQARGRLYPRQESRHHLHLTHHPPLPRHRRQARAPTSRSSSCRRRMMRGEIASTSSPTMQPLGSPTTASSTLSYARWSCTNGPSMAATHTPSEPRKDPRAAGLRALTHRPRGTLAGSGPPVSDLTQKRSSASEGTGWPVLARMRVRREESSKKPVTIAAPVSPCAKQS